MLAEIGIGWELAVRTMTRRTWIEGAGAGIAACALAPILSRSALAAPQHAVHGLGGSPGWLVVIPAGNFLMGTTPQQACELALAHGYHTTWLDGEVPQRVVHLPAYAIGKFPVTNLEYAAFCAATGHPPPPHWEAGRPPRAQLRHPVIQVNRSDAQDFAAWLGLRLPTEAEWEKAARGPYGRTFPWGDAFDPAACRWNDDPLTPGPGTAPVDAHPGGASPYGVLDMVGNVGEWCADGPSSATAYVKGGAWVSSQVVNLRPAARNMSRTKTNVETFVGFRCVMDLA